MYKCELCPRKCGVDRRERTGFCGVGDSIRLAKADLHFFEEPCISGNRGAGTVFFSGCNLSCVYCQNAKISHKRFGQDVSPEHLREIFLSLIDRGAHNIELVTPTQFIDKIAKALTPRLPVPIVYNSGGYESAESLKQLDGLIDIYMPDMKYAFSDISKKYSNAEDYPSVCLDAIGEMYRQVGDTEYDGTLLKKGVIIRHLILPKNVLNTKAVIKRVAEFSKGKRILFSLMAQYTPCKACDLENFPELQTPVSENEYRSCTKYLERFPELDGFVQELCSSGEEYIPDFDLGGI